ncbi:hypothetical protein DRN58_06415, partial [Thermococci archaeon]
MKFIEKLLYINLNIEFMKKIALLLILGILISGCISMEKEKTETPTKNKTVITKQEFAIYKEYPVDVTPSVKSYNFKPENMEDFYLSGTQKKIL